LLASSQDGHCLMISSWAAQRAGSQSCFARAGTTAQASTMTAAATNRFIPFLPVVIPSGSFDSGPCGDTTSPAPSRWSIRKSENEAPDDRLSSAPTSEANQTLRGERCGSRRRYEEVVRARQDDVVLRAQLMRKALAGNVEGQRRLNRRQATSASLSLRPRVCRLSRPPRS